MNHGWLWLGVALTLTAAGQLTFKHASVRRSLCLTGLAIVLFCAVPWASYMALHSLSLATVYVSTALSQIAVVLLSMALFGERYVARQWFGLAMIVGGVILFNARAFG